MSKNIRNESGVNIMIGGSGTAGPIGPMGATGPSGSFISKGDTGQSGLKGDTGEQGIQGPIGPAGTNGNSSGWNLTGNASTDPLINYLGTSDNQNLNLCINGIGGYNKLVLTTGGRVEPVNLYNCTHFGINAGFAGANNSYFGRATGFLSSGSNNVGVGDGCLTQLTSGSNNIAMGVGVGQSYTTNSNNILIGNIGAVGVGGDNNVIKIGNSNSQNKTYIAGIRGITPVLSDGLAVLISSQGQLYASATSSTNSQMITLNSSSFPANGEWIGFNTKWASNQWIYSAIVVNKSCTISNLTMWSPQSPGTSNSRIVTLVKNGITTTSLTTSVTGSSLTSSNTVNSFTCVAGDQLAVRHNTTGTPVNGIVLASYQITY